MKPIARPSSPRRPVPAARRRHRLGVAIGVAHALGIAVAQVAVAAEPDAAATRGEVEAEPALEEMLVIDRAAEANPYAERGAPYKARRSGDFRHTALLADTPQTLTVLTREQLQDAGLSDLRDVLDAQPGITLGTGENGNAFGDRYIIRGHEARSDVWVDGLRDPGMTTRESFATEQIEITKGPSSTFAGRGSTGGAINGITKQASTAYDFAEIAGGVGSDGFRRTTLDWNERIDSTWAVRANLLHAYQEVPDRAPAEERRDGALVSASFEPIDALRVIADAYVLRSEETPDLGSYFDRTTRSPVNHLPVYLQEDADFLDSDVATVTLRAEYRFDDGPWLRNALRYGWTDNAYVVTGARAGTRASTDPEAPSAPTLLLTGHQGWQDVAYFAEQFAVGDTATLAGMRHEWLVGFEYLHEQVRNGVFALTNTAPTNCLLPGTAGGAARAGYCGLDANGRPVADLTRLLGRTVDRGPWDSDYEVATTSLYAMDTITLAPQWRVFAGVRYDRFDYGNDLRATTGVVTDYAYDGGFWNGHVGLVYAPLDNANVYFTYSTSTNLNGGESDLGGSCGYGGLCGTPEQVRDSEPEQATNFELGAKVELLGDKLLLTAALFRMTKDDVMESVGNAYSSLGTLNTGRNRVQGLELGMVGNLTPTLSVQAGAAFMKSEVLRSFDVASEGRVLSNFVEDSAYLQVRWQADARLYLGATVTYSGESYAGQPDSGASFDTTIGDYAVVVPSYTVVDVFAGYEIDDDMRLRLNVANVTDKDYYLAAYRSGTFLYKGDARNAQLTFTYDF